MDQSEFLAKLLLAVASPILVYVARKTWQGLSSNLFNQLQRDMQAVDDLQRQQDQARKMANRVNVVDPGIDFQREISWFEPKNLYARVLQRKFMEKQPPALLAAAMLLYIAGLVWFALTRTEMVFVGSIAILSLFLVYESVLYWRARRRARRIVGKIDFKAPGLKDARGAEVPEGTFVPCRRGGEPDMTDE